MTTNPNLNPAPVRPRVYLPGADEAVLLEDEVAARLERKPRGLIELTGPPGSGASTAIDHLAYAMGSDPRLVLADEPDAFMTRMLEHDATHLLVVCAGPKLQWRKPDDERWRLKPWAQDECIEYLLAVHRERCASVMRRVLADPDRTSLFGRPELWRVVLDRLAEDESLPDVKSALRSVLSARLPPHESAIVWLQCFAMLSDSSMTERILASLRSSHQVGRVTYPLLRHALVQTLLAAEHLAGMLRAPGPLDMLEQRLPQPLVEETARLLRGDKQVAYRLYEEVTGQKPDRQAMAASLLHAAGANWIPDTGTEPELEGAYLAGVEWPGIELAPTNMIEADLTGANLREARLPGLLVNRARLAGACLHGAQLANLEAYDADLSAVDLSFVRAPQSQFVQSNLRDANLSGALLKEVNFALADLSGARLCRADLSEANLRQSKIAGADFSGADLSRANLAGLALRVANFSGAKFVDADLDHCDLELMKLPSANFKGTLLYSANFTGSYIPEGQFCRAMLRFARLAEIDWERADLREADLRSSTFHMGSSRSGLVGSPIACEGSRTGFYTDELSEQDFKAPEEIRKANLCGADLRGANIEDVDFYLVDLRGARYTVFQEAVFRRCGAILESRV